MKNNLVTILKVLVSGVLLYLISKEIDWSQLIVSIKQGRFIYLFIGIILGCGFNVVKFIKWHYLIRTGDHNYSFLDGVKSYMIGNSLGLITPMRAGDLGRALYFHVDDRPRIIGLTVMDRFTELVAVLALSIGGCFVLLNKGVGMIVVSLAFFGILSLYAAGFLHGIVKRIIPDGRIGGKIIKLMDILRLLDKNTVSIVLLLSFVAFVLCIIQFYFLIIAFEKISLSSVFLATPLVTLSSILPVSIMGLGVREGISIVLLAKFNISAATAVSAAFLFFLINNVSISGIGIYYLSKVRIKTQTQEANCEFKI